MRQNLVRVFGGVAVAVLLAGGAAACKADSDSDSGSGGSTKACGLKLGFFGALSGDPRAVSQLMNPYQQQVIDANNAIAPSTRIRSG